MSDGSHATPAHAPTRAQDVWLVCFWLGGQQFGVKIDQVKETIVLRPVTRVFLVPPWVAGLINLRGDVVAVVDLAAFFGLPPAEATPDSRVVIARSGGRTAGLLVDRLSEVRAVDLDKIAPAPPLGSPENAALVAGVVTLDDGAPLVVLDLVKLFDSERLRQFARKGA